jgi:hypothetical protein
MTEVYEEIIDFIVDGMPAGALAAFKPSEQSKARLADLVHRRKTTGLNPDEEAELDTFLHLEHVLRLAKARARKRSR